MYVKRLYYLNKLGISLSKEDKETLDEILELKKIISSCEIFETNYYNTFFIKENKVIIEYSPIKKMAFIFHNEQYKYYNHKYISFILNDLLNIEVDSVAVTTMSQREAYIIFNENFR